MANKAEQVSTAVNKTGQSPGYKQNTHRRTHDKGASTSGKSQEENSRKKANVVLPASRNHGKADKESRSKGATGPRDSTQQNARHESKHGVRGRDSEQQHGSSRHGRPILMPGEKGHRKGHHHKQSASESKGDSQTSKRGHRSHHGSRKVPAKGEDDTEGETNPDSGISIEESSSPEVGSLPQEGSCEPPTLIRAPVDKEEEIANEAQGETKEEEENGSAKNKPKITYSREDLLSLRGHCLSHVRPKSLPYDVLRASTNKQSQETTGWVTPDQESVPEDTQLRHPTTLSLIREHDTRFLPKVSLSPQRRSFGSGCSWRDAAASATNKQGSGDSSSAAGEAGDSVTPHADQDDSNYYDFPVRGRPPSASSLASSQHGPTPTPTPTTPHTPRVINHVPYLSRQWGDDDHGAPRGSWRNRQGGGGGGIEEEPEWMAFGPSDRSEVIELRGLEEHEARKEAAKVSPDSNVKESPEKEEEVAKGPDSTIHAEGSSYLPQDANDSSHKEGPIHTAHSSSSSPKDDFIVDGFDFSTGVSICHELASDSGDDEEDDDELVAISPMKGPQQLGHALMKVLGVKQHGQQGAASGVAKPVRAMMLDEIEERTGSHAPSADSPKQTSAFDKFFATMHSSSSAYSEEMKSQEFLHQIVHPSPTGSAVPPIRANPSVVTGMMDDHTARVAALSTPFQEAPLPHSKMAMRPFDRVNPMVHRQHMGGEHSGLIQQWPPNSSPWPPAASSSSVSYNVPGMGLRQHVQQQQQHPLPHSLMMSANMHARSAGSSQQRQNTNWVMEMEQQRLHQIQQLREEQMREEQTRMYQQQQQQQQQHHMHHRHHMTSSPSISLLPTAVLRQMHNAKPKQQLVNEMTKPPHTSVGSRLEQELNNQATSQSGYNTMMGPQVTHHTGGLGSVAPLPYHTRTDPLLPQGYTHPHYRMGVSTMNPAGATY